jgi:RHS repeat-associated protein
VRFAALELAWAQEQEATRCGDDNLANAEDGPFASDMVTNVYWSRLRTNLTLIQPTGVWSNLFAYSSLNRLQSVASPAGTFTYTYADPSTRMTYLNLPSGAYVYDQYDTMSRLTNSFLFNSSQTPLDGHVYQYDRENQRTSEIRADNSTVDYKYDNIGQLKIADSSVPAEDRGYNYDAAWNLHYRTNNGSLSTFIVDNKNQLTNSFAARNVYDSNGNMVTNNNNHNVLVYDDENQLTRYYHTLNGLVEMNAGDTRTDFIYDGLGRLRKRIEWVVSCNPQGSPQGGAGAGAVPNGGGGGGGNGCTWGEVSQTWYVYDGWRVIQERDSNNVPTVSYTRGNDLSVSLEGAGGIGGLLARSSGYSSGIWASHADYYADADGNVTSIIDSNQAVVASYRYDPFGNIISKSGTLANANVYRFSSKEVHVNSGMYYYGLRFYDPNLQRWVNRDPVSEFGGLNLYGFVFNNSLGGIDPLGLCGGSEEFEPFEGEITRELRNELEANVRPPARNQFRTIAERFAENVLRDAVEQQMRREGKDPSQTYLECPKEQPKPPTPEQLRVALRNYRPSEDNAKALAKGGVYVQTDPNSGEVMRGGRSKNLQTRQGQHGRDPGLKDFVFKPLFRTDNYDEQRGLEHVVDQLFRPPLNKIRALRDDHPNKVNYISCAHQYLKGGP